MSDNVKKELQDTFDAIMHELVYLHSVWATVLELYGKSKDRLDFIMERASNFFGIIQDPLIDFISLGIAKLLDPPKSCGKENLSLERVVVIIEGMNKLKLCEELRASIESLKGQCAAIETHRNKRIAHFDYPTHVGAKPNILPVITRQQIELAFRELDGFMNKAANPLKPDTEFFFEPAGGGLGARSIIARLIQATRYEELQREGKISLTDFVESKYAKI